MDYPVTISDMIYEYTFSPSGNTKHYLSIAELQNLLKRLIDANATAEYVQVIPFYKTAYAQQEFENEMLFVKELAPNEQVDEFLRQCAFDEFGKPCKGVIRCFEKNDLRSFRKALTDYMAYIALLVRNIYIFLTKECHIENEDLLCGCICFAVYSK